MILSLSQALPIERSRRLSSATKLYPSLRTNITGRWPSLPCASCATPLPTPLKASLADPAHSARLAEIYAEARTNPLWAPLETVLAAQPPSAHGPLEPALRDYILLITILVAFLEATAQQLRPYQPPVVMAFSGVIRQEPTG